MKENIEGSFSTAVPHVFARGSKYGPLQTDGFTYLCPDCGGYGYIADKDNQCLFCKSNGTIPIDDSRIRIAKEGVMV